MKLVRFAKAALTIAVVTGLALGGYLTQETWLPWVRHGKPVEPVAAPREAGTLTQKVILTDQALKNLGLAARPLKAQTFWKTIPVPGMVVDRAGRSDRSVVSPLTGVVGKIAYLPGDTVRPGEVLFTVKLLSEPLHTTQTELFKTTQEIQLAQAVRKRLMDAASVVPEARIIEANYQITRLRVMAKAARHELLNRGLAPEQVDEVAEGKFVKEIAIAAPAAATDSRPLMASFVSGADTRLTRPPPTFEVQELKVELGQQVQAGQTLCLLANHQSLSVEGRAFRDETGLLERSVKERWPVEVDFQEDGADWPALDQTFRIRHLANSIDPVNRTFAFLIPLENQARVVEEDGRTQMLWRFRPGQKVRVRVRVEKLDNVFVLPAEAVTHDGPEAFVFTQNVNTFERKSVRVILQDRRQAVVPNDGSLLPGAFVAQSAAAQLNRMVKAASSVVPKGFHIHADGSLHKNEDEGK